ncbi:MAG: DUF1565 domain-containing protein, partial [Anaerolineales bacterium]|nr:DUF1565 domain-containing protein [Anaerolineales bacterium]
MCVRRRLLSVGAAVSVALLWAALTLLLMSRPPHPVSAAPNTLYVAPPPTGDDANPCSASDPCATVQHAVDVAHADDEIQVATGVYTGVQARDGMTQVLFISKTVTVRGGYSPGFGRWNPAAFPTTLDAQRQGRVVSILGAGPTLEGLIITGGDATSVTLNCPTAGGVSDGCGGGVFVFGGSPLIVGNVISGNIGARSVGSHSASGGGL